MDLKRDKEEEADQNDQPFFRVIFPNRDGRIDAHDKNANSKGDDPGKRNVIKALEDYFSVKYDESSFFTDFRSDMLIKHYPYCNGLTVVKRIG